MVSKVYSGVFIGMSGNVIEIEVSTNKGLRAFNVVGLADKAIEEAKERVNTAIKSIGLAPPNSETQRVLVNLAPANLKKEGSLYDLPIALAYLLSTKQTDFNPEATMIAGELSLDGRLKPVKGALPLALLAVKKGFSNIILPKENCKEAALSNILNEEKVIEVIGCDNLKEVIDYLENRIEIESHQANKDGLLVYDNKDIDFAFIKGQTHAKRGLEIAAAGSHNVLLEGPPGTGKSLMAKSIVSILPELSKEEMLELTKIYSIAGLLTEDTPFIARRPFRAPHHTSSESALIGGGTPPKVGEITLSHRGVLFLDEFPEFHRDALESLRQPLESGEINIQRAKYNLNYPANFSLIAAANPCPCGFKGHPEKECLCSNSQISSYRKKLSGPLIDRIDIFCWVSSVSYEDLIEKGEGETSCIIRERVKTAREIQKQRFKKQNISTNSQMNIPQLKEFCQIDSQSKNILKMHIDSGNLSARGYHRLLKMARTMADLQGNNNISFENIAEALSYRDRKNN